MSPDRAWSGKNVLVTGVGGFIGSRLAVDLHEQGAQVMGLTKDFERGLYETDGKIELAIGDVCDYETIRSIVSSKEIDVVYHLAAISIVRICAADPLTTYRTNVMGTVSVLEAVRNVRPRARIIVASSDKAYGDHEELPYREEFHLQPKNTYDTSKACADMIAQTYGHNYGMDVAITRCSNVYGPGDLNESRIIPGTISRVLRGERPMLYSDIEQMSREFIYIDDVVRAYDLLGTAKFDPGSVFNIGGNGAVAIRDIAQMILGVADRDDLKPNIVPREPQFKEIQRQCIDSLKLREATGWVPAVSLFNGLLNTLNWWRDRA